MSTQVKRLDFSMPYGGFDRRTRCAIKIIGFSGFAAMVTLFALGFLFLILQHSHAAIALFAAGGLVTGLEFFLVLYYNKKNPELRKEVKAPFKENRETLKGMLPDKMDTYLLNSYNKRPCIFIKYKKIGEVKIFRNEENRQHYIKNQLDSGLTPAEEKNS